MPELKLGVALSSFGQPLKKALHMAASLGVAGVEIDARKDIQPKELSDTGRRQLRKMLDDLNLRVAAVRFATRRGYDTPQDLDRRIDATKEAMRFAQGLGARVVVNSVGYVAEDCESPGYQQLRASLSDLARYSERVGTLLAAETGSEPVERLVELLDSLPEQAIGVTFSPGNLIVNDCYDEGAIKLCAARTLHVHANDGVRDLSRGRGMEVPLGRGSAEYPHILGVLEERHYQGWFVVDRTGAEDPFTDTRHAISFLRAI